MGFGWCNFYFLNLLDLCFWSCGPFIVLVLSLLEQLVPVVVGFCLCLGRNLQFWNFEKRANRANVFLFSRIGYDGLPEYLFFFFVFFFLFTLG